MKWIEKYYNFENSLLDELNTFHPKHTFFDVSEGEFYYEGGKIMSIEAIEFKAFDDLMWFANYGLMDVVIFPDIEDLFLKASILDYIKEKYENI